MGDGIKFLLRFPQNLKLNRYRIGFYLLSHQPIGTEHFYRLRSSPYGFFEKSKRYRQTHLFGHSNRNNEESYYLTLIQSLFRLINPSGGW
jgi:hypothetical protein